MKISNNIVLAPYTSFFIGGPAKFFCEVSNEQELTEAIKFAQKNSIPIFFLGGGSNILISGRGFDGLVIRLAQQGLRVIEENGEEAKLEIAAGQPWDSVVEFAVAQNLWGIENLSHIPGSSGALAVQNVGAYGQEASDVIQTVTVYDIATQKISQLTNSQCHFRYRASIFNNEERGRYVILSVVLKLQKNGEPNLSYGDMAKYFENQNVSKLSLADLRQAIIDIRNRKYPFPVSPQTGSAGSFFRGPVISVEHWNEFESKLQNHFDFEVLSKLAQMKDRLRVPQGYKTPTAFLIDICGFKGFKSGGAIINPQQAAVILNTGTAKASDVLALYKAVRQGVVDKSGVILDHEPEFVGFMPSEFLI